MMIRKNMSRLQETKTSSRDQMDGAQRQSESEVPATWPCVVYCATRPGNYDWFVHSLGACRCINFFANLLR